MIKREKISKYSQIGGLLLISVVLIFWPYVQLLIPTITLETLLGIFVTILIGIFLYFDSRLSTVRKPAYAITSINLNECFSQLSSQFNYIRHMRIYALSTGRIHPLFSSSNLRVGKCDILLRGFSGTETEHLRTATYQSHIKDMIFEWEKEVDRDKIRELSISRFFFMPTEYYVIFDDKAIIAGLFLPTADNWGEVIEPILIQSSSKEGVEVINKYITRFDQLKTVLNSRNGENAMMFQN